MIYLILNLVTPPRHRFRPLPRYARPDMSYEPAPAASPRAGARLPPARVPPAVGAALANSAGAFPN